MLRKLLILSIISIIVAGCSSSEQYTTNKEQSQLKEQFSAELKKKAQEAFIRGSIADLNQQYATAILEYQEALNYDPQAGIYFALAQDYLILNKLPLAVKNSKKSVELDPENPDYLGLLGKVYLSSKQPDSAIVVYKKMTEIDSTDLEAMFTLGYLYEKDSPLKALETYKKLIRIAGPEWNALVRMADLYDRMGKIDEAVSAIEDLSAIDPSNLNLQKLLLETYVKAGKTEKAIKLSDELLVTYPDDAGIKELKAQSYIAKEDWKEAAALYNDLFKNPELPHANKYRIAIAYYSQSFQDSLMLGLSRTLFETLDKDTTDWQIKFYLGDIAMRQERDSAAVGYYKDVINLAGWNPEPWMRLGGLYFDNQDYEQAIEVLNNGVKFFPEDYTINLILGLAYSQSHKYEDSEKYLKKAVSLNSQDVIGLSSYAYTLNQLDSTDLAIDYINKSLNIDPNNAELWGMLGMIYNDQKRFEDCDKAYSKAIELDPESALINNNFAYALAERGVELDRALKMATFAVEKEPANSSYWDTQGWVYYMLGDLQKAKELVEKSYKMNAKSSEVVEHLADIHFKLGNKSKAMDLWKKAFELDGKNQKLKDKIEKGEL